MPDYTPAAVDALFPAYNPGTIQDPVTYTYNDTGDTRNFLPAIDFNQLQCEVLKHQDLLASGTAIAVRNETGGTLAAGTLCYLSSWSSGNNCYLIAKADVTNPGKLPIVVLDASLTTATNGSAYLSVAVTGLDTTTASAVGSKVYADPATPGSYVFDSVTVTADQERVEVGIVTVKNVVGTIQFYPGYREVQSWGTSAISNGAVTLVKADTLERPSNNLLINGGFVYYQRQDPTAATTIADQGFGPDRWKSFIENANVQAQQVAGPTTGTVSSNYGRYTKITNTGKIFIAQIVEALATYPLVGQDVIFQLKARTSTALTFNIGVIYQTSTADSPTAAIVSAYNANGTDPTLSGWTAITPNATGTTGSISGNYARQSLTTSFATVSVCATIPAGATNIAVVIFPNNQMTAAQYLEMAEAGLYLGNATRTWQYNAVDDLANCQRFYEKSFNTNVEPKQNSGTEVGAVEYYCKVASTNADGRQVFYKVPKRITPSTVTFYSPSAASSAWYNISGTAASGASTLRASGMGSMVIENAQAAGDATGNRIGIHWSATAEI